MGIITYFDLIQSLLGFPGGAVVKNPPSHAGDVEDWVRSLGLEDLLAEGMATHSNILAWRIPWTEEPVRLQSRGLQRVRYNWRTKHTHTQLDVYTFHSCRCLSAVCMIYSSLVDLSSHCNSPSFLFYQCSNLFVCVFMIGFTDTAPRRSVFCVYETLCVCSVTSLMSDPLVTPWTAACQAPPSMGFSRQEYWSGVPLPSPKEFLI